MNGFLLVAISCCICLAYAGVREYGMRNKRDYQLLAVLSVLFFAFSVLLFFVLPDPFDGGLN